MTALEAKDFIVEQVKQQAALEQVPLSDLEVRMMYFTESGEMREDFSELNDKFEAEYDTDEYEAKIAKLARRAYQRLKRENLQSVEQWDSAVEELQKGDHYLLVLIDQLQFLSPKLFTWSFWKLLGIALLALFVALIGFAILLHHQDSMRPQPRTSPSLPPWLQHMLLAVIVGGYLAFLFFPRPVGKAFSWILENTLGRLDRGQEKN